MQMQQLQQHSEMLSNLSSKVENLEDRMMHNSKSIETKLDQLVELMQKVTQLQEREARNAGDIQDLRILIRETSANIESMNRRWHERMDTNAREMETCRHNIERSFEEEHKEVEIELKDLKKQSSETDKELNKWLNRGVGAWIVGGVLITLLQSWGAYVITEASKKVQTMDAKLVQVDKKLELLEQKVGK